MVAAQKDGFDFSNIDLDSLDLERVAGSADADAGGLFALFGRLGDLEALTGLFSTGTGDFKQRAFEQLTEGIDRLEKTRAAAAKLYEARLGAVDKDLEAVSERLARAQAPPTLRQVPDRFTFAGKLREPEAGVGLPQLTVEAFIREGDAERVVERVLTDAEGNFMFSFGDDVTAANQEVYVRALGDDGEALPGTELRLSCRGGEQESTIVDVTARDRITGALAGGQRLAANRNARTASLRSKRDAVQTERDAALAHIDTDLAHSRDLLKKLEAETPDEDEFDPGPGATRYMGNTHTRELHDLENRTRACRLADIRFDHRFFFEDPERAIEAGYDYCAHCFGSDMSKR